MDVLSEVVPSSIFYAMFSLRAVLGLILGVHSLSVASTQTSSPRRTFTIWLGIKSLLVTMVDGAFFALAFYVEAAVLTGIGIFIFLPGCIAVLGCLISWIRLVQEEG